MTLAGIELRFLVNEIAKKTTGYYVSNIYGIDRTSLLFKLHHPEKNDVMLMVSPLGLWLSSVKIEQIETNRLLKRLRNDLLRLKLSKIEQIDAERIAYLTFSGFDKEFIMVGEFFGDGNLILCNKEMKILALLHGIDVRHRQLRVGLKYQPPPQSEFNIFNLKREELDEIRSSSVSAVRWLGRTLGLPTKYAEEVFWMAKVDPRKLGNELSDNDISEIFDAVNLIVNKVINGEHDPFIIRDGKKSDVIPFYLEHDNKKEFTKVNSFIEGLDILFTENIIEIGKSAQTIESDQKVIELENKITEQTKAISIVKQKSQLIANVARSLMDLTSQGVSSIDDPKLLDTLKKNNSKIIKEKGISLLKIEDEKINVDLNSSIPTIASSLFDVAKRKAAAISSIEKLKEKTEKSLAKQKNQADLTKERIIFSEVRKRNWYERYRWFFTSDGILAIGGRDSSSNSAIIRKHLAKNDKVFHADIYGSPFFVLKNGQSIRPSSLNETAHATVCFSRAWREAMYGLSAFWVEPNQIKTAAPSGQFLAKGAFVIEGQRNYVNVATLKLAIGLIRQDSDYLITCGPPEPIKKKCICYTIIEPGGSEMVDVAKKIKAELVKMRSETKSISLDDVVRVLPAGKSHIVETGLGDQSIE